MLTTCTKRALLILLVLAPLAGPLIGQQEKSSPIVNPSYPREQLELHAYRARHVDAHRLAETIAEFYMRRLYVVDDESDARHAVENLTYMGDTVVVYDTPEHAARILTELGKLDTAPATPPAGSSRGSIPYEEIETLEYSPRYVSVGTLRSALNTFHRNVLVKGTSGNVDSFTYPMVGTVADSRKLIVRDLPEQLTRIEAALARIDVPRPQVTISCWVLRATDEGEGGSPELPRDLVENLRALVPFEHFQVRSIGVLRTSIAPREAMQLAMPGRGGNERYALKIVPDAFDEEQGVLSLRDCSFDGSGMQSFRTSTTVRRGEYTVLGGVGAEPVFVVLQIPLTT